MEVTARDERILAYLEEKERVDISFLSQELDVSEMTIRRDLTRLEKQNLLVRVYGGAKLTSQNMYEPPIALRAIAHPEEKDLLAKKAASFLEDGDTIILDDSTTTLAMVPHIDVSITVVTNHINVAVALKENENVEVILLGGRMKRSTMSTTGQEMNDMMKNFNVDKAFLSAKAINVEKGVSDASVEAGLAKKLFISAAKQTYFLFDESKLETCAFYNVCSVSQVHHMIVAPPQTLQGQNFVDRCQQLGITLHIAE